MDPFDFQTPHGASQTRNGKYRFMGVRGSTPGIASAGVIPYYIAAGSHLGASTHSRRGGDEGDTPPTTVVIIHALLQVEDNKDKVSGVWEPSLAVLGGKLEPSEDRHWLHTALREFVEEGGDDPRVAAVMGGIKDRALEAVSGSAVGGSGLGGAGASSVYIKEAAYQVEGAR